MACHFSGSKSVKTVRWRISVCTMTCHVVPSRIGYELFTKCVTPNVTHVHLTISSWFRVNLGTFQNVRHDITRTDLPDPHRRESLRTLSRVLPSLARQIACPSVNPFSCQRETCFSVRKSEFWEQCIECRPKGRRARIMLAIVVK